MAAGEMVELRRWLFPEVKQLQMRVRDINGQEVGRTYFGGEERRAAFLRDWFPPDLQVSLDPFASQHLKGLPARRALDPGGTFRAYVPAWVTIYQGMVVFVGQSGELPRFRLQVDETGPSPAFAVWDSWGYGNGPDGLVPGSVSPGYSHTEDWRKRLEAYEDLVPDAILLGYLREPAVVVTPAVDIVPAGVVTVVEKGAAAATVPRVVVYPPSQQKYTVEEPPLFDPVKWAQGR